MGRGSWIGLWASLLAANGVAAQEAPEWKNLRVFPGDVPMLTLARAMIENVDGVGLRPVDGSRCAHCHLLDDFASADRPMKLKAREMMALTLRLNEALEASVGPDGVGGFRVTCATCHRGSLRPPPTPDTPVPGGR